MGKSYVSSFLTLGVDFSHIPPHTLFLCQPLILCTLYSYRFLSEYSHIFTFIPFYFSPFLIVLAPRSRLRCLMQAFECMLK